VTLGILCAVNAWVEFVIIINYIAIIETTIFLVT
jgi:hypothetical protein